MRKIVALLLLLSNVCLGQRGETVDSLLDVARKEFYSDYKRTIALTDLAIGISRTINDPERETIALNLKGATFQFKGDVDSAFLYLGKARTIALRIRSNTLLARINANIGTTYFRLANYERSLYYGFESLKLNEKIKDTIGTARVMADIANSFIALKRYDRAIEYLQTAIKITQQVGNIPATGNFYNSLGVAYNEMNKLANAEAAFKKGLEIFKENNNLKGQLSTTVNVSELNFLLDKPMNIADLLTAEKIATDLEDKQRLGEIYTLFAKEYHKNGAYAKALQYIGPAIKYAEIAQEADGLITALKVQSDIYYDNKQADKAYAVRKRIDILQDSIYNEKSIKQLHEAEVRYETDKKQKQIQLLNKQATIQKLSIASRNKTIGIIAGLFLLSLIVTGLIYSRNKLKQKSAMQSQLLLQQETLTRAVIEAEEKERQRIASDLHDGVGQLFSAVKMNMNGLFERVEVKREEDRFLMEKTMAMVEESCKEVRSISHQMMPNNMLLRSGIASDVKSFIEKIDSERLNVNLESNGFKNRIESNVEVVLYRVIQESVNNVIKHAKATRLDIVLNRTAAGISVLIKDNGIGFNSDLRESFDGIGLKNIETRIEYLKGTVVFDSAPGKGTRVIIQVPVS